MEASSPPDREAGLQLRRLCAPNGRISLGGPPIAVTVPPTGFLLLARTPLLLPSINLVALASAAVVALAA
jgi:hypothetical protein